MRTGVESMSDALARVRRRPGRRGDVPRGDGGGGGRRRRGGDARAAYDRASRNKTSARRRERLEHNVTAELVALVRVASESLGALDADA